MAGTVKLTGFRELHNSLGEFKKSTERSILRRVAVKALEPIAERARQLAPVDDGTLRDSITVGTNLTSSARRESKKDPAQGVRVFAGTANRNGVPREFGTWRTAAHPFLRPAWDAEKDRVLEDLGRGLKTEIDKAAARAAKRGR